MLENYMYTESEQRKLLSSIVVLVDTREQRNQHITDYFDQHNIPYKSKALDYGDYSFMLPKNEELGIFKNISFEKDIVIERKNSAEELALCLTKTRQRFEDEFIRGAKAKKYLVVENCDYKDIITGNYNSEYKSKSYLGSLHSFEHKFDLRIMFLPDKGCTPVFIIATFNYYLRGLIK